MKLRKPHPPKRLCPARAYTTLVVLVSLYVKSSLNVGYEGNEPATFEGLAPQVLVHHASFPCTKITKVPKFERNHCHPTNYWLVWGQFATQITQTREGLAPGIHIAKLSSSWPVQCKYN